MKTPDGLFFAPGIRFKDIGLDDRESTATALSKRAYDWFFTPAMAVASMSPFASGVITCCFIDAAAEFSDMTFIEWTQMAVPDARNKDPRKNAKTVGDSFYEDVRNGLVHHARLSRGAEFSTSLSVEMSVVKEVLVVNPELLGQAVIRAWDQFIKFVRTDPKLHRAVADRIARTFRLDVAADERWQ